MPSSAFDITDKVIFITGAGRGIGRGIAEVLAHAGADVALNALTTHHLEPSAAAIAQESGRRVLPIPGDMTDPASVNAAVDTVIREFGRIDVLVNAVGDAVQEPLVSLDVEDIERDLSLNLRATLLGARAVGPHYLERRSGKVINISGVSAVRGGANLSVYAASKAGVQAFTRALALEWAPFEVTVNCIAPGIFPDERSGTPFEPKVAEQLLRQVPLGHFGDVLDVGHLAHYLASSASDYLTGQTIYLDGGLML